MYVNKSFFLAVTLLLTFIFPVEGHEKKWPEKRLRQVWPTAQSFISKQISLTPSQMTQLKTEGVKIGSEDRIPTFYFAQVKESPSGKAKSIGIILFIDEYGDNGLMEISVAMGSDGKTKKIDLWEHTENSLIAKDDFLKQFLGKTSKDTFIANKDYQLVPNASKASEAMARAVEKALKITDIIFKK
ncbi:MAG: hypothetical protein PHY93_16900 [Bacteriovorax sp.]|nr:hypothetical protein [Bacteriovorax sp.]